LIILLEGEKRMVGREHLGGKGKDSGMNEKLGKGESGKG